MIYQQEQLEFSVAQGESNVYIVKLRDRPAFKIGKADCIEKRHKTLSVVYDFDYSEGYRLNVADAKEARELERMLHLFCKKFSCAESYKGLDGGTEMYSIEALPGLLKNVLENRERLGIISISGFASSSDCANVAAAEAETDLTEWWSKVKSNLSGVRISDGSAWMVLVFVGLVRLPSHATVIPSGRIISAVSWARYVEGHTILQMPLPDGDWSFEELGGGNHYDGLAAITNDLWVRHVWAAGSRSGFSVDELLIRSKRGEGVNLLQSPTGLPTPSSVLPLNSDGGTVDAAALLAKVMNFRGLASNQKIFNFPECVTKALSCESERLSGERRGRGRCSEKDVVLAALLMFFERQGIFVDPATGSSGEPVNKNNAALR